jgi:hypothetical protein
VRVEITGDPDRVHLLVDGRQVVSLSPPFQYDWDTASVAEGSHALMVRATAGHNAFDSASATVVVDRTAPSAEQRPLPPQDTNMGVHDPLVIAFSEPMNPGLTGDGPLTVQADCGTTAWLKTLSEDGKTVTIQPLSTPTPPCTVSAAVGGAATDLAGNPLPPTVLSWKIPVWQRLGDPISTDAGSATLVVGADGQPVVAYVRAPGSADSNVFVAKWDGQTWTPLGGAIGSPPASDPSLALDAGGNPTIAWVEGAPHSLKISRWEPASGWVALPSPTGPDPLGPSVAVSASGVIWLAYRDGTQQWQSNPGDCVQRLTPGSSSWTSEGCRAAGYPGGVSIRMESDEGPLFAYSWIDQSGMAVLGRSGSSWVRRGSVPTGASIFNEGLDPSLAASPRGTAIAWKWKRSSDPWKVFAAKWSGGDWPTTGLTSDSALNVDPAGAPSAFLGSGTSTGAPSVAIDASGAPVVAWVEPRSGVFVKRLSGSNWVRLGDSLNSTTPMSDLRFEPSIATDCEGNNLAIAWNQDSVLYVHRYNQ